MIKKILINLGSIISFVVSFNIFAKIKSIKIYLYTGYLKGNFARFGVGSKIIPSFTQLVGGKYIHIGNNCLIGSNIQLTAYDRYNKTQKFSPLIVIGDGSNIGDFSHITSINKIQIGKNVLMGRNVLITDNSHGTSCLQEITVTDPKERNLSSKGPVIIEDDVWICEKASILPGVVIGKGSIIGANAVISKNVPPYTLVVGNPIRFINLV